MAAQHPYQKRDTKDTGNRDVVREIHGCDQRRGTIHRPLHQVTIMRSPLDESNDAEADAGGLLAARNLQLMALRSRVNAALPDHKSNPVNR